MSVHAGLDEPTTRPLASQPFCWIPATCRDTDTRDYYSVVARLPDGREGKVRGTITYATVGQSVDVLYTTKGRLVIYFASNPPQGKTEYLGAAMMGGLGAVAGGFALASYRHVRGIYARRAVVAER